jgi:NAD(P)-dependent dehydrogenase (short-subunit alcohol dehydrogenase family)
MSNGGRLEGKVAVVTGGGNGIGRACCVRFAEEGASVVVADLLDDAGAETVALVEKAGGRGLLARTDVTSKDDVDAAVRRAVDELGGVDVLVTAAGISHADYVSGHADDELQLLAGQIAVPPAQQLAELPLDRWQRVLDVNLTGTLLAVQAAVRTMVAAGTKGSIVTIASIAAKHPEVAPLPYCVSKAGVWMLTKHVARTLGPLGIRANAVGPGFIDTNMTAVLHKVPGVDEMALAGTPLGRFGRPEEVAAAALFLASDDAAYVTGEILHPDGGFYTD